MGRPKNDSGLSAHAFARRCKKIFGRYWTRDAAFNFDLTRQAIEQVRDGIICVSPALKSMLEECETGKRVIRARPPGKRAGRPRKVRTA